MKHLLILILASLGLFSCQAQTQIENSEDFEKISWEELNDNAIRMIGKDWMLVTAGDPEDYNMMTASWGSLGWLWQKPVVSIFIHPERHTHNYTEREEYFTISFYKGENREVLSKMGSVSGRKFDKMNYEKLTALTTGNGSVAFKEAALVIECKKLYADSLSRSSFMQPELAEKVYFDDDYHTMYVGEIINVWRKK
ncbi:MAG: flavin reductase [Bacteroidales bacterium]|nr:flavin reductase [Bacteroidales bacterium]